MEKVTFSVNPSNTGIMGCLETTSCQAVEWTIQASTFSSLACKSSSCSLVTGRTPSYTVDGLFFNTLRPYVNNVWFRRAMQAMTDYPSILANACSTSGCSANPWILPYNLYPGACYQPTVAFSLLTAANDLLASGLAVEVSGTYYWNVCTTAWGATYAGCTPHPFTFTATSQFSGIQGWFIHSDLETNSTDYPYTGGETVVTTGCNVDFNSVAPGTQCQVGNNINLYWRNDDPIRSTVETVYFAQFTTLNFMINVPGITDEEAGGDIYGASASGLKFGGSFNPTCTFTDGYGAETGCNTAPAWIPSGVNGTSADWGGTKPADSWDMYTFGWVLSASPLAQGEFFNSIWEGSANFMYYNMTMDHDSDSMMYANNLNTYITTADCNKSPGATGSCSVDASAVRIAKDFAQSLPYVVNLWENELWACNVWEWTGCVNEPGFGPGTSIGIYYTLLNSYDMASNGWGGNFQYVLHGGASSLNPIYFNNWVWQADLWSEFYDGPLATAPTSTLIPMVCTPSATGGTTTYINWMTTKSGCYTYTGKVGSGSGTWSYFQGYKSGAKIVGGEEISYTFRSNMTFTDNVPFTLQDMNFSLYAWDIACNPNTPDLFTPDYGALCGPSGIVADQMIPGTGGSPGTINIYINSSSVWNEGYTDVGVLPWHIWQYIKLDPADEYGVGAVDLTQSYAKDMKTCTWASGSTCAKGTAPAWLLKLPNLEVGTGPFYLGKISGMGGDSEAGTLFAFGGYQRTYWLANATSTVLTSTKVTVTGSYAPGCPASGAKCTAIPYKTMYLPPVHVFSIPVSCSSITTSKITVTYQYYGAKGTSKPSTAKTAKATLKCANAKEGASLSGTFTVSGSPGVYEVTFAIPYTGSSTYPAGTQYFFTGFTYK